MVSEDNWKENGAGKVTGAFFFIFFLNLGRGVHTAALKGRRRKGEKDKLNFSRLQWKFLSKGEELGDMIRHRLLNQ